MLFTKQMSSASIFRVRFKKTAQTIGSSVGNLVMKITSYEPAESAKDQNYVYMLFETNYPDSIIHSNKTDLSDQYFRDANDGAVKNVNGKLMSRIIL